VRPLIESRYHIEGLDTDRAGAWRTRLRAALAEGVRVVIGAGGDGTVNAAVSALLDLPPGLADGVLVGAVGLGSSNDLHKPLGRTAGPIPVRIDAEGAAPRDVVRVRYEDVYGIWRRGIFLVSASIGVTAAANRFFNEDALVRRLKRGFTNAAILYAAVRTIARHAGLAATLRIAGEERTLRLANLSVLKSPHLSGGLVYDTPVGPASGRMGVNLLEHRGPLATLVALSRLQRGRFRGLPGTDHWSGERLAVRLSRAADLELDGEVVEARRARFQVMPGRIRLCA
jgi:diacylglycerol kinase family enzyme